MSGALGALLRRDLLLAARAGSGGAQGLVFFLILVTIVPFAIGPDLGLLGRIGPAILWIATLLATLLGLDRLFGADHEDGSLDGLLAGEAPLEAVVLAKGLAHWLLTGLPLVIAAPLFGLMLGMSPAALASTAAALLAGTPALTAIGAIGAALTVTLRRGGLLLAVLILPLAIPVLIFGVAASSAAVDPLLPFWTPFLVLCGLSLGAIALAPFAVAAALRGAAA